MKLIQFFDKTEDSIRGRLSHHPVIYALIAGVGSVLFFHGVWNATDALGLTWHVTLPVSMVILLLTGAFVSHFVSDQLIVTGIRHERKLVEKTEKEIREEAEVLQDIESDLAEIVEKMDTPRIS